MATGSAIETLKAGSPVVESSIPVDVKTALDDMARRLAEAEAREAAALARAAAAEARATAGGGTIRAKVQDSGMISIYGVNARFPVNAYEGGWTRMLAGCSCHGSAVEKAIEAAKAAPGAADILTLARAEYESRKAAKAGK